VLQLSKSKINWSINDVSISAIVEKEISENYKEYKVIVFNDSNKLSYSFSRPAESEFILLRSIIEEIIFWLTYDFNGHYHMYAVADRFDELQNDLELSKLMNNIFSEESKDILAVFIKLNL
jgi:hypothetical protein